LIRHSLHSQTLEKSLDGGGDDFFAKKSITLPDLSSLATFSPEGSTAFSLTFSLGLSVCVGPAHMKLGNDGTPDEKFSVSVEATLNVFDSSCESFIEVILLGDMGLLKVKLLMDSRFLAPSDSLIGLANLKGSLPLSAGFGDCFGFEDGFVYCGSAMSKRGRLEIGRGMVGRLTASTVSSSSSLVFFLAFSCVFRFGSTSASVLM
jgi:hypothetical protein